MLVAIERKRAALQRHARAARRVIMPWAEDRTFNVLNDNGRTVLRRALEWAAEQEQPEVFDHPLYVQYEDPAHEFERPYGQA